MKKYNWAFIIVWTLVLGFTVYLWYHVFKLISL